MRWGPPPRSAQRARSQPRPVSRPASAGPLQRSWGSFLEASDSEEDADKATCSPGKRSSQPCLDVSLAKKNEPLLRIACGKLGWEAVQGGKSQIVWVLQKEDIALRLRSLQPGQWLSHLPGLQEVCSKKTLGAALKGHSNWPRSWNLPEESEAVIVEAFAEGQRPTLIVKPDRGSQGAGIALTKSPEDLQKILRRLVSPQAIVQEYIADPLLLSGFKWDARIYVLLVPDSSDHRLHAFMSQDGLARVCVDPYEAPTSRNLHKQLCHLTNYSVSKLSDKYAHNDDPADGGYGCKRSLRAVLQRLGPEVETFWRSLERLVLDTVAAITDPLLSVSRSTEFWNGDRMAADLAAKHFCSCFQILGFDVLIDEQLKPWLLELNNNPSLSVDEVSPLLSKTRAEVNQVFAAHAKTCGESKWDRPCRCSAHPRPHRHKVCPVDLAVKLPVVMGTLQVVQNAKALLSPAEWAKGTSLAWLAPDPAVSVQPVRAPGGEDDA